MRIQEHNLFPTPILVVDLEPEQSQAIKEYYADIWADIPEDPKVRVKHTWGKEQPKDFCPTLNDALSGLIPNFFPKVNNLTKEVFLGDYWFQDYAQGSTHMPHTHPGSVVSGVYYIESNNQGSPLVFFNQNSAQHFCNYATYSSMVECWEGRLVLFPSWLLHAVPENRNADVVRRIVAFNVDALNK